jgi:hypothetical protein
MCDNGTSTEVSHGNDPTAAWMYGSALLAGFLLIVLGDTTPLEASGFVSPILVMFEQRR